MHTLQCTATCLKSANALGYTGLPLFESTQPINVILLRVARQHFASSYTSFYGPPLFGLYPNGLFMIGLSPFGLPMTFGLSPFGLF